MQALTALRAGIRILRSSPTLLPSPPNAASALMPALESSALICRLGLLSGSRAFSQPAACSPAAYLDRDEVTSRVVALLRSVPFIDPVKVKASASFKDLHLDALDTVEVMIAAEAEFAVDIPSAEADKILTTTDLINYIAAHPQAK